MQILIPETNLTYPIFPPDSEFECDGRNSLYRVGHTDPSTTILVLYSLPLDDTVAISFLIVMAVQVFTARDKYSGTVSNKPFVNEVTLRRQNPPLKYS